MQCFVLVVVLVVVEGRTKYRPNAHAILCSAQPRRAEPCCIPFGLADEAASYTMYHCHGYAPKDTLWPGLEGKWILPSFRAHIGEVASGREAINNHPSFPLPLCSAPTTQRHVLNLEAGLCGTTSSCGAMICMSV